MSEAAERMRRIRLQRRSLGLCIRCGSELTDKHSTCLDCRVKYYRKNRDTQLKNHCVRSLRTWKITNRILFDRLESLGMTIREFACEIGVSNRTVERWLFEETIPSFNNMNKINSYLGEDIYLADGGL